MSDTINPATPAPAKKPNRRALHWDRAKNPKTLAAIIVSTACGAGLFPLAPGTMGTLFAVPLAFYTAEYPAVFRFFMWLGLLILGTWSAKVMDETMGSKDNQNIVIDEVVGYGITAWTAGTSGISLAVAFLLFRFFDVLKPPPVRQMDEWSKIKAGQNSGAASRWWGGFGVMADDVLAGFQGLIVMLILQHFKIIP